MGDIRQYLVTTSDDGVSVRRVELTVLSGMHVQLPEGTYFLKTTRQAALQASYEELLPLELKLPVLYDGKNYAAAILAIKEKM